MVGETDVDVMVSVHWMSTFVEQLEIRGRSKNTIRAYCQDIRSFAKWFEIVNRIPLQPETITSVDLRAWREYSLNDERISPATWNRRRTTLRVLTSWAQDAGYLDYDPFQGIERFEQVEVPPRWLNKGELLKLLRHAELLVNGSKTDRWRWQAIRDQAMICLMIYAGLREGEVVALDIEDIEIGKRKGTVTVRRGKGDKSRLIPLNKEARRAISNWLDVRGFIGSSALFIGKKGRLTTRTVQRRVAETGRQAGLSVTPHQLRHTFAKRILDNGTPLTVLQKLLGHARLETTARYTTPGWEDYEEAVERI